MRKSVDRNPMVKKTTSVKAKPAAKEEDSHSLAWEAGKFCLDLAKLVFAGVILVGLMRQDIGYVTLTIVGVVFILIFIGLGFYLMASKSNKR